MRLGDRVKTYAYGPGTIVGFEVLGWHKTWLTCRYEGVVLSRIVVALDNPKAWICVSVKHPHPYMMRDDFEVLP